MRGRRWPTWVLLAAVHTAIAVFFLSGRSPGTNAACTGLPLDDGWIHLVYGRSVAQSGLPYYNEHELEAGFTSPAWVVVCAAAHWLAALPRLDAVLALKILGTLIAIAMTWGVCELARICCESGVGALLAGLLSALTPALAFSQVSGMEVCLAACFGLWAVCAWHRRRYFTVGVLLALAFWTRPEMLLLCGLVVIALLREWLDTFSRDDLRALLKAALPTLAFGVLWSGYCLAVTGRILPNTFYAKFTSGHPQGLLTVVREAVWTLPVNFMMAGAVLYALGVVQVIRRPTPVRWVTLFFPWCFFTAIAVSRYLPPGSGNSYYWLRYVVPALPFLYPIIAAGWRLLWPLAAAGSPGDQAVGAEQRLSADAQDQHTGSRSLVSLALWSRRGLAIALAVLCLAAHPHELRRVAEQYAWNCQNINEVQVDIGRWVAESTPEDAAIVVNDAGALRYFGQRRTIDLMGLNHHALAHDRGRFLAIIASPHALRDYMGAVDADYLIVFPPFFPGVFDDPRADWLFESVYRARSENYTIVDAPQDLMVVYKLRQRS